MMIDSATGMSPGIRLAHPHRPATASHSATSSGNLFGPASGERRIEGGWRQTRRLPYWLVAASAALLLGGVVIARKHSTNNKPHN